MSQTFSKILLLISIAFFSTNAFAQATTGTIEGTVTDSNGAVIPGATVSVENSATGFKKSIVTDQNGYFVFTEVPFGTYKITVTATAFKILSKRVKVPANKGNPNKLNLALKVGVACIPYRISDDEMQKVVPRKTTFSSILKFTPNVRPEVLSGGFQFDGASGSENVFSFENQEITNFRTGQLNSNYDVPFEIISEVQVVKRQDVFAEYGSSTGGVINVYTERGNNRWRGNFGISFTPNNLQGSQNVVINRFGTNAGQIEFFQPNRDDGTGFFPTASVGGAIIKDRFWFFASYSPQIYRTTRNIDYFSSSNPANRTINETIQYKSNVRTEQSFVRLDVQPTSKLRMFGAFLYNPIIQEGTLPAFNEGFGGAPQSALGLRGAEYLATRGGRQNSNLFNGQITWVLTNNVLINFRAGRTFLNEKLDSYGIPRITRFICSTSSTNIPAGAGCTAGFQNIANNSVRDYDVSTRTTFDTDGTLIVSSFGRHDFKFGYQFNRVFNKVKEGYTDTGIVQLFYGRSIETLGVPITPTAGNLGSGFLQRFGTVGEGKSTNQAFFAQDSWQIKNRLTLNLGVRFENEDIPDYGQNLDLKFGWKDKISPRIGFVFDVLGDGKNKIFGSFGFYYDRLKFELSREQFPQVFYRDFFEILPSRGANYANYTLQNILGNNADNPLGNCPISNSTGYSVCQFSFIIQTNIGPVGIDSYPTFDPNLKPQRTTGYTIGFERDLGSNFRLTASYIHRQLDRAVEDIGVFNSQGSEAYFIGNPGFNQHCEINAGTNFPCAKAERKYDALEIVFDKRATSYFFNANYTYSRLYGNYSGLTSSDEFGRVSPNVTRYFDLPPYGFDANGNADNGRLATDRPHYFKAFGGYTFRWNTSNNTTTVSAFTTIQTGTPLTTVYSLYNLPTSILYGRGDLGRTETFTETDLLVSHRYKFGKNDNYSFEPFVVFLNLFNESNELTRQTTISSTNFTSTTLASSGCTTCSSQIGVFNTLFNGGINQFVQNYLNTRGVSSTGIRNDYNQPNLFQSPGYLRFGLRVSF
ncbi:MAG TPA: TonB-dependent receptor [Pyrinomonadaceae bacterium]|nr:TonB-dependent receptor [Pyrinomonadaceae bacterium]